MAGEIKVKRLGPKPRFAPIRVSRTEEVKRPIVIQSWDDVRKRKEERDAAAAERHDPGLDTDRSEPVHPVDDRPRDDPRPAVQRTARRSKCAWTKEEEDTVRTLTEQGLSPKEIGEAIGRTESAVIQHRPKLRPHKKRNYELWTPGEVQTLLIMLRERASGQEICETLGRTNHQVWNKICRLRRSGMLLQDRRTLMRYTPEEDAYMLWTLKHGGSDREMAHDLGRTLASIRQRVKYLKEKHGLPDRRTTNSGRKGKR